MKPPKIISIILAVLSISVPAFSQDEVERVDTNLVTLNVSVVDGRGRAVKGLKKDDFAVTDNGTRQDIESFSLHDAPVSVGVIYDIHRASEDHTRNILAALREFSSSLGQNDDIFVSVIGERAGLLTEFVPTEQQILDNVTNANKTGKNSLYDAIFEASEKLATARNSKRLLILLTDGADRSSHHSPQELRLHLRSINLPVYSVTFGGSDRRRFGYYDIYRDEPLRTIDVGESSELDRAIVEELARSSGGQSFDGIVRNKFYLTRMFAKVIEEVRDQYVLGFYPDKLDGKYHKLKVSIQGEKEPGLKISTRKGYQSRRATSR